MKINERKPYDYSLENQKWKGKKKSLLNIYLKTESGY